jgi:prepilin-type processing-associated H-X9-DG protein
LHQLGLAVQNYSDSNGYLPSSIRPANATSSTVRVSTLTFLLPFIEQNNLYANYNQAYNWWEPTGGSAGSSGNPNGLITATVLPNFICPSSPNPARLDGDPDANPDAPVVAVTDYGATIGVDPALSTANLVASSGTASGALYRNGGTASNPRLADITDGLSNTILYAESAGRPYIYQNGVNTSIVNGIDEVATAHVNGGGWSRPASELIIRGSDVTGTIPDGPYAINVTNGFASAYGDAGATKDPVFAQLPTGEVYAFHPGGANVVLADGSVRLLAKNTSIAVLAALVTRAGGEATTQSVYAP